jgi:hypothetical protein
VGELKSEYKISVGGLTVNEREYFLDLGIDGRIVLKRDPKEVQ